jgi:hypothetical protein
MQKERRRIPKKNKGIQRRTIQAKEVWKECKTTGIKNSYQWRIWSLWEPVLQIL